MIKRPKVHGKFILATMLTITLLTVLMVALPPSAQAVIVDLSLSQNNVEFGDPITFTTTVRIEPGERIPVENAILRIYSDPGCTNQIYQCEMTLISVNPPGNWDEDWRYGYDHVYGYGFYFGWGYGYGYDYGYGTATILTYRCTINTGVLGQTGQFYSRTEFNPVGPNPSPTPWYTPDCGVIPSISFLSDIEPFTVWWSGNLPPMQSPTPTPTQTPAPTLPPSPTPSPTPPGNLAGRLNNQGMAMESFSLSNLCQDCAGAIFIPEGTFIFGLGGHMLDNILINPPFTTVPPPPSGSILLGVCDFGPDGTTFSPPVTIEMSYDLGPGSTNRSCDRVDCGPNGTCVTTTSGARCECDDGYTAVALNCVRNVPKPEDVFIARYDPALGKWVNLNNILVNPTHGVVRGDTDHFTLIGVFAQLPPEPTPTPTVTTTPEPTVQPTPTPTATPTPTKTTEPSPTPEPDDGDDDGFPWWVILLIVLGFLGLALFLWWWFKIRQQS